MSNSSSSSFVCVIPKTIHDQIMKELNEKQKSIIEKYVEISQIGDMEVAAHGHANDNNDIKSHHSGSIYFDGSVYFDEWGKNMREISYDDFENADSAYNDAIKKSKCKIFTMNFDF